jgi:hypothetical protein
VLTGVLLVDADAPSRLVFLALLLGAVATAVLLAAGRHRMLATPVMAVATVAVLALFDADSPVRATIPWACFALAQACYLRQDRASLGGFVKALTPRRPGPRDERVRRPADTAA